MCNESREGNGTRSNLETLSYLFSATVDGESVTIIEPNH